MERASPEEDKSTDYPGWWRSTLPSRPVASKLFASLLFVSSFTPCVGHAATQTPQPTPPQPVLPAKFKIPATNPCQLKRDGTAMMQAGAAAALASDPVHPALHARPQPDLCPPLLPFIDWYARFLNGPQVKALSPSQKLWLATRNLLDPFNGMTILASSAIDVGSNSHGPYGPGMTGFGRNVGVSFTQDMTGEFFGTFLIPSIVHQDPHYHRLPNASIKRRIAHALYQVVWTQGDDGKEMVNYANLVGFAIDDEIGNLYVPGQQTSLSAGASRYGIGLATAPIDNFITEFLPDVARRIHVRIVLVQRIINKVANTGGSGP